MLEALNIIVGLMTLTGIAIYAAVLLKRKHDEKELSEKNAVVTYGMGVLEGEVVDIIRDNEKCLMVCPDGCSRITVVDRKGNIRYGYSRLSVKELEMLYLGKGYVQVPVITEKKVAAKLK